MATVLTDNRHYSDIADAIRAKGAEGTFLPSEMAAAIASIPSGSEVFHTTGTVDYRGYNINAVFTVPYSRPERNVIVMANCIGVWYKNENDEYVLSESRDFSLTGITTYPSTIPLSFLLLSPGITRPAFSMKTAQGKSLSIRKINSAVLALNPYNAGINPTVSNFSSNDMTFSSTNLSQTMNGRFATADFGTRWQYEIYAWGETV